MQGAATSAQGPSPGRAKEGPQGSIPGSNTPLHRERGLFDFAGGRKTSKGGLGRADVPAGVLWAGTVPDSCFSDLKCSPYYFGLGTIVGIGGLVFCFVFH